MTILNQYGWNPFFEDQFTPYVRDEYQAGRIIAGYKGIYRLITMNGEFLAEVSGKMRHQAVEVSDYPAVGDWVVATVRTEEQKATIHAVLPRKSKFSRKTPRPGAQPREQILAANMDRLFLLLTLNNDFSLRRLERYLTLTWESGAGPVIILSKADLCSQEELKTHLLAVEAVAMGVPVHIISAVTGAGIDNLRVYLREGQTIALLGSSGVGKSTLINHLLGQEALKVQNVRTSDEEGRHTTTHRELVPYPGGGLIMDTPGLREIQLWESGAGLEETFEEIDLLAHECRFHDCRHENEPGCAVQTALQNGTLNPERLISYRKLKKELRYLASKQKEQPHRLEKRRVKPVPSATEIW